MKTGIYNNFFGFRALKMATMAFSASLLMTSCIVYTGGYTETDGVYYDPNKDTLPKDYYPDSGNKIGKPYDFNAGKGVIEKNKENVEEAKSRYRTKYSHKKPSSDWGDYTGTQINYYNYNSYNPYWGWGSYFPYYWDYGYSYPWGWNMGWDSWGGWNFGFSWGWGSPWYGYNRYYSPYYYPWRYYGGYYGYYDPFYYGGYYYPYYYGRGYNYYPRRASGVNTSGYSNSRVFEPANRQYPGIRMDSGSNRNYSDDSYRTGSYYNNNRSSNGYYRQEPQYNGGMRNNSNTNSMRRNSSFDNGGFRNTNMNSSGSSGGGIHMNSGSGSSLRTGGTGGMRR